VCSDVIQFSKEVAAWRKSLRPSTKTRPPPPETVDQDVVAVRGCGRFVSTPGQPSSGNENEQGFRTDGSLSLRGMPSHHARPSGNSTRMRSWRAGSSVSCAAR
jgi:hypothetical protein